MRNFKIIIEYDGSAYCGWQRQPNGTSIQQVLEEAIKSITGKDVSVIASGRTDAGVHAIGQAASFRAQSSLPEYKLFAGINSVLPPDIALKDLQEMPDGFNALKDAKNKVYLYRIKNQRLRPALGRQYYWFVRYRLDLEKMRKAASLLAGEHDFSAFCATGCDVQSRVRRLAPIEILELPDNMLEIKVESGGFLRHMVRNIVGTLVDVGRDKIKPEDIPEILASGDRRRAGTAAPACGLFLKEVEF